MEGLSLRPFFDQDRVLPRQLCWEHLENRGIRDGRWKLVAARGGPWELYDMHVDPTELNDLVESRAGLVPDLAKKWAVWATRIGVKNVGRLAAPAP
jgi:arylsulfatase